MNISKEAGLLCPELDYPPSADDSELLRGAYSKPLPRLRRGPAFLFLRLQKQAFAATK